MDNSKTQTTEIETQQKKNAISINKINKLNPVLAKTNHSCRIPTDIYL